MRNIETRMDKNKTNTKDTKIWFDFYNKAKKIVLRVCARNRKSSTETQEILLDALSCPCEQEIKSSSKILITIQCERVYGYSLTLCCGGVRCGGEGDQVLQLRCIACDMIGLMCFVSRMWHTAYISMDIWTFRKDDDQMRTMSSLL